MRGDYTRAIDPLPPTCRMKNDDAKCVSIMRTETCSFSLRIVSAFSACNIVAFEKERKTSLIWLNKGPDNSMVIPHLESSGILNHARSGGYTSVLIFHNHPNPDPMIYNLLEPSAQDLNSAVALEAVLSPASVNLLEFICERGRLLEYHRGIAPSFFPIQYLGQTVLAENGCGRLKNLQLHLERLF